MTETPARIRWEPTKYGGWTGHVGTLETWLFQIYGPALAGQRWVLTATFPGALNDVRPGTPDELKAEAERWLAGFVASLGAVFPEPLRETGIRVAWNEVSRRLCAVHPDDGTYAAVEISFGSDRYAEAPVDIQDRASAPGGRRLVIGPTLAEIRAAFESSPPATPAPMAGPQRED